MPPKIILGDSVNSDHLSEDSQTKSKPSLVDYWFPSEKIFYWLDNGSCIFLWTLNNDLLSNSEAKDFESWDTTCAIEKI